MVDSSAELRKEWLGGFLSLEKGEGGFAGGIGGAAGPAMAVKDSIDELGGFLISELARRSSAGAARIKGVPGWV